MTASATDLAGNRHTTSAVAYSVQADTTAPGITPDVTGTKGANDWYITDVALAWDVVDAETPSSISKTDCGAESITSDQQATTYSCSASSRGGSTGPVTVSIKRDATAPIASLSGLANNAFFYEGEGPASLSCEASDATSRLADADSTTAIVEECVVVDYDRTTPGTRTATAFAVDNAGNTGTSTGITYTVLDDVTPPVISRVLTGTEGQNGWYTTDVTLTWTVTESETPSSLVKTGCEYQSVTADQGVAAYSCDATSAGGDAVEATVSIKRDATAPTVSPANVTNSVWRNTNLSQPFTASDSGSGLATAADENFTLTASAESADASTPTVATKTVTDLAGNGTTRAVSAMIDKSGPVISGDDVNNTTWRNTPLSANFTASDRLSGLASSSDATFTLTASAESESAATPTTASKTVSDVVGNTSTRTLSALIDLTEPGSSVSGVTSGAVYATPPTVSCIGTDGLSGIASHGTVSGNSTTAGAKSVTCNGAVDNAGNVQTTPSSAVNYTLAPIGSFNSNFDGLQILKVKPNQAIPLKWAFNNGTSNLALLSPNGTTISSVSSTRCSSVEGVDGSEVATELAAGASGLQLLPDNSYQINWKATSSTGCRALTVTMGLTEGGSVSRTILVNIVK